MNIFVIGQLSLQWGRLEYGNIGNYYITEPFFGELRRSFPDAKVRTTFQLTETLCNRFAIKTLPLEYYYGFRANELELAKEELSLVKDFLESGKWCSKTPYIEEVLSSDVVIDFSGDMWGDNADIAAPDRFSVGLIKDAIPQLLGKYTAMLAGSPGPFVNMKNEIVEYAKWVWKNFRLITNREAVSTELMGNWGFCNENLYTCACPAFIFEGSEKDMMRVLENKEGIPCDERKTVGLSFCGWNFENGPFNKWPREKQEYKKIADVIEQLVNDRNAKIVLLSHSNGFPIPPKEFELLHGRDYPIMCQIYDILKERQVPHVYLVRGIYNAKETKSIIATFDMMVSGRVHAAVAALSSNIPTVIIDYGFEPKAHKLLGFAKLAECENYISTLNEEEKLYEKIVDCFDHLGMVKSRLIKRMPEVKEMSYRNFDELKKSVNREWEKE